MATTKLSNSGTTGAKYPTASADNNYICLLYTSDAADE